MALTETYYNGDLGTGSNNGTSEANAWQTWAAVIAAVAPGDRMNCKQTASRDVLGGTITFNVNGDKDNIIHLRGYLNTPGDGGFYEADNQFIVSGGNVLAESLDIEASSQGFAFTISGDGSRILRSRIFNTNSGSTGGGALSLADASGALCWLKSNSTSSTTSRPTVLSNRGILHGCVVVGGGNGYSVILEGSGEGNVFSNCLVDANGAVGVLVSGLSGGINHQFVASNTIWDFSDGISIGLPPFPARAVTMVLNNILYNGSGTGILQTGANTATNFLAAGNAFGNITTANFSGFAHDGDGLFFDSKQLTADPFTNAAGGDFSLNNVAGGGALLRSQGLPTDLGLTGAQNNFLDVGALQARTLPLFGARAQLLGNS